MTRKFYILFFVTVAGLLLAAGADSILAQFQQPATPGQPPGTQQPAGRSGQLPAMAPQGGRYGTAAPQQQQQRGAEPQANGPLSLILGPVGDVPEIHRGNPRAPTTDTFYFDLPPDEWPPDEFISNPDREFDWHNLKGWHYVPNIQKITILGNRLIKPGESIRFEAILEDVTGTISRMGMTYFGPQGRRSTLHASMTPVTPGSNVVRGELRTSKWAEPGVYRVTDASPSNETRHSKVFWADYHPGMRGLEFEVLPNPDADVIPPAIEWVKLNTLDASEGQIRTQRVQDPIPIFAKITDNKSGVEKVTVRMVTPGGRFIEAQLNKVVGHPDIYGAMLSIPQWWEGGEYKLLSMWANDKADKEVILFQTTHPVLKNARIMMQQDPANVDKTPPTLFSVWINKDRARLGEPVQVNAIITDDKSGVGTVAVMFAPYPSYIDRVRVHLRPVERPAVIQKSGLDISANLWTGTLETIPWFEPGEWRVDRVVARDNADNYLDLLPEYTPELSDVKLTFTGGINLREEMMKQKKGMTATSAGRGEGETAAAAPQPAGSPAAAPAAGSSAQPGKIRRVDMTPPHPPRGACLNCHEP